MKIEEIETIRLANSSPETVFEWLKHKRPKKKDEISSEGFVRAESGLENVLLNRSDKLINLGLALYGCCAETGQTLFQMNDPEIRNAVLSGSTLGSGLGNSFNSWLEFENVVANLIENIEENKDLLESIFSNELVPDDILVSLFSKTKEFADLPQDNWISLLYLSYKNKRLLIPYNEIFINGDLEFDHNNVFFSFWKLYEILPVNESNLSLLGHLSDYVVPKYHGLDIFQLLSKWKDLDTRERVFFNARMNLAKLIPTYGDAFESLKNSSDKSLRYAYYSNFIPTSGEELRRGFEKDGEKFIEIALDNSYIFKDRELRYELNRVCWDAPDKYSAMVYPNEYRVIYNNHLKSNPEWFSDEEKNVIPFEKIDDPIERINRHLNHVDNKLTELTQYLTEKDDEKENNLIEEVNQRFQQLEAKIIALNEKPSYSWAWALLGIVVGYFIGAYMF